MTWLGRVAEKESDSPDSVRSGIEVGSYVLGESASRGGPCGTEGEE